MSANRRRPSCRNSQTCFRDVWAALQPIGPRLVFKGPTGGRVAPRRRPGQDSPKVHPSVSRIRRESSHTPRSPLTETHKTTALLNDRCHLYVSTQEVVGLAPMPVPESRVSKQEVRFPPMSSLVLVSYFFYTGQRLSGLMRVIVYAAAFYRWAPGGAYDRC